MGVNPTTDQKVIAVAEIEEFIVAFFRCVAGVRSAQLVGNDKMVDEERVGDECPAKDAAGFKVSKCISVRYVEEGGTQVWR